MCHIPGVTRVPGRPVILFDLDGTLTDSGPGIVNCLRYALDAMGVEHPDDATMRVFLGPPLADTFRSHFGMDDAQVDRAIALYRERYVEVGLFENSVYEGIPQMLDELGRTEAVLAVSTSKPTVSATRILDHFDLTRHFAFIGGADLHGPRQHKADVIEHTLEALAGHAGAHPPPGSVMVGDREHDVRGALAHGIPCIGVLWGYGSEHELIGAGAVGVVATPAELLAELVRER